MSIVRSMTGFARARRSVADGEVVVSAKSVNHRGLDIHIHAPSAADPFENAIRTLIKKRLRRGHVDVRIVLPDALRGGVPGGVNRELLDQYLKSFREAAAAHGLDVQPDLNAAMRIPGMFGEPQNVELPEQTQAVVLEALGEALDELNRFREREGSAIRDDMAGHNAAVAESAAAIEKIRSGATAAFQARLTERLGELLQTAQIDPQRLAQEAAILADRSDISEELSRLKIHSIQLGELLEAGGEAGKKLDFLLQEMNRETNTILSKTSGLGDVGLQITELGLAAKAAIEKLREQSLNLE